MFYVWRRMQEEDRRRVWLLYGWFSGLVLCGSCFGAVSWAARMTQLVSILNANDELSCEFLFLLPCASRNYHWLLVYVREQVQPVSRAAVNIATTAAAAASLQPHQKRTHSSAKAFVAQEKRL
jgi:hypothetical protein